MRSSLGIQDIPSSRFAFFLAPHRNEESNTGLSLSLSPPISSRQSKYFQVQNSVAARSGLIIAAVGSGIRASRKLFSLDYGPLPAPPFHPRDAKLSSLRGPLDPLLLSVLSYESSSIVYGYEKTRYQAD